MMSEYLTLQLSKIIKTPRSRAFAAWTQPAELMRWFAPGPMRPGAATVDLRLGGRFRLAMTGPSPRSGEEMRLAFTGTYDIIVPDERLRFTWEVEGDPGDPTVVTVDFNEVDGGTEVLLTQERIPNTDLLNRNRGGWSGMLDKLARLSELELIHAT
jgi:uncharacterized protein YndB with AHSA1/START domain